MIHMKNARLEPFAPSRPGRLAGVAAAALSLMLTAAPLAAQTAPGTEDLRALRFYVQKNETAAVQAEINRLKAAFPGWVPPTDLGDLSQQAQSGPTTEIADIYARLGRGDIEGMRRVVQKTQARFPGWQVPPDLARAIELAEAQVSFDRAVNARDTGQAVRLGSQTPSLFRCDRINNAWNLAELQSASGNPARALAAYRQIVATCTTVPDLVATIEKAEAVTSDAELSGLIGVARQRFTAHGATFTALERRLLAGRGRGTAPATASVPVVTPTRPETRKAEATAATAQPAALVATAQPTPVAAPAPPVSAVTSPVRLPRSGDSRVAQTRSAAGAGNFADCLARSANPQSLDIAYERSWCAYNLERPLESLAYFAAAAQGGLGGTLTRDARFGMALSMLKLSMTDDAARIAAETDLTLEQRRDVEVIILDQRGVRAYEAKDYRSAVDYFDALEGLQGGLRRDLAILRGYAHLNLGDRDMARAEFQALHDVLATAETRSALNAAR